MAKNRVMAEKNERVRKADIERKKENQMLAILEENGYGYCAESVKNHGRNVPKHGRHPNKVSPHGKKIVYEYKTAAITSLMERIF